MLLWLLLGVLVGWSAVRLTRLDAHRDILAAIALGMLGALVAGLLSTPVLRGSWDWAWHPVTAVSALFGAVLAIAWLPLFLR